MAVHCQKTVNLFVSVTSFVFHIHTSTKHPYLYKARIGQDSLHFICEALERNELRLNMNDKAIEQYIETFDINITKLRMVLELLCRQCLREKKRDFSRIFDRKKEIMPGFDCYVLVTRI